MKFYADTSVPWDTIAIFFSPVQASTVQNIKSDVTENTFQLEKKS